MPGGVPVLTLLNASDYAVLRSQRCWIQSRAEDGATNRTTAWLASGAVLAPGEKDHVKITPAPTQSVWRVEFEAAKWDLAVRLNILPQRYHAVRSRWISRGEVQLLETKAE